MPAVMSSGITEYSAIGEERRKWLKIGNIADTISMALTMLAPKAAFA